MVHFENQGPQLSEVDMAYELLQIQGTPKNYYDLIVEVLTHLNLPIDARQISSVLTQINLDTRFAYAGHGEWGLKAWAPIRSVKKQPSIALVNKAINNDDEFEKDFSDEVNEDMDGSDFEDGISDRDDSLEPEIERFDDKWKQV